MSLDTFVAELRAAKLIKETQLSAQELAQLKALFAKAQGMADNKALMKLMDEALESGDYSKLKNFFEKGKGALDEGLENSGKGGKFGDNLNNNIDGISNEGELLGEFGIPHITIIPKEIKAYLFTLMQ